MRKSYINKQIKSAEVSDALATNACQYLPANVRQARPLASLPAEDQPEAWEKAGR
ncbi:hypothetical protein [Haloferula sp.]|uniref:hypothetical protein n=1 Tax=Haloferula sp. TaxID=2497595 RepID=UPI003C7397DE